MLYSCPSPWEADSALLQKQTSLQLGFPSHLKLTNLRASFRCIPACRIVCDVVALTSRRLGSFSYSDHRRISVKHSVLLSLSHASNPLGAPSTPRMKSKLPRSKNYKLRTVFAFPSLYSVLANRTLVRSVLQACPQRWGLPLLCSLAGMPLVVCHLQQGAQAPLPERPFPLPEPHSARLPRMHPRVFLYLLEAVITHHHPLAG